MIAVDASVAVKWLIDETGSDRAVELSATTPLVAPTLLRIEVGNALFKKVLRGEIAAEPATLAHDALPAFVSEWVETSGLADTAFVICMELLHPVYDCYYLALAELRDIQLVTADRRLIERCRDTRFHARLVAL